MADKELSPLQKEFRKFFQELLDRYKVKSPAELTKDQKVDFFNAIALYWENGKGPKVDPDKIPGIGESQSKSFSKDILENLKENLSDVEVKHHIDDTWGSDIPAEKTAKKVCDTEGDLKSAISAVDFYYNRLGSKATDADLEKRKEVLDILHTMCQR